MTVNKSLNLGDIQFHGQYGNLSVAKATFTFAAAPVDGDTLDLIMMPAGFEIVDAHIINGATTGTGTKLSLGHRHVDGTAGGSATSIIGQYDSHVAGRTDMNRAPVIEQVKDSIVYATMNDNGSTFAAAFQVDVVVKYRVSGTQ